MSDFLLMISGSGLVGAGTDTWAGVALLGALAFILGFALNYGSICTVIATRELVVERRPARFIALLECAIWAALVYAVLEQSPMMQQGWSPLVYLVPAAVLFGLGTYINGACVFGAVGHFGNGEFGFGFAFIGIIAVVYIEYLFDLFPDRPPISPTLPVGQAFVALVLLAVLALRFGLSLRSEFNFVQLMLSMGAVGTTFAALVVLAPGFAITASVGWLVSIPVAGAVISVCMFGGSLVSASFTTHQFEVRWPTLNVAFRRTFAGMIMGLGALLIPGGNDALLMIGFPLGAWQAALAYVLFVATLAALVSVFGSMAKSWS